MIIFSTTINKTTMALHLNSLSIQVNHPTYNVGNPGPGLGNVQKCGGVTPVKWIQTLHWPVRIIICM